MDFILVSLTVSFVYAVLPASVWRLITGVLTALLFSEWVLRTDLLHVLLWVPSTYFVAYALNSLVDSWSSPGPALMQRRLRSPLPPV